MTGDSMIDKHYYSPKYKVFTARFMFLVAAVLLLFSGTAHAEADLAQPIGDLARKIAAINGPGPARLTVRNRSSLTADQVESVRKLLEQDLRNHGVIASGYPSRSVPPRSHRSKAVSI